jgi:tight adherence protein C
MHFVIEHPHLMQAIAFLLVAGTLLVLCSVAAGNDDLVDERLRGLMRMPDRAKGERTDSRATLGIGHIRGSDALAATGGVQWRQLQMKLAEAGLGFAWASKLYVVAMIVLACALSAACLEIALSIRVSWSYTALGVVASAAIGMCLPGLWLESRRAARHAMLRRALPDFLDLVVACLGAGMSVQAALKQVAGELRLAHPVLCGELNLVLHEVELGRTLDQGLQQLAARTGLEELRTLCSFVYQASKFGSTITDALQQLADMLRVQREQRAEELAQKAAVKILFPTLLFIFPTVFVVLAGPAAIQINEGLTNSKRQDAALTQTQ